MLDAARRDRAKALPFLRAIVDAIGTKFTDGGTVLRSAPLVASLRAVAELVRQRGGAEDAERITEAADVAELHGLAWGELDAIRGAA